MVPIEVRAILPDGIPIDHIRAGIEGSGGFVVSVKEDGPIQAAHIGPRNLAAFLKLTEPSFRYPDKVTYRKTLASLRDFPISRQEELLEEFFGNRVIEFPQGREVGRFLARANNMTLGRADKKPSLAAIREQVSRYAGALGIELSDIVLTGDPSYVQRAGRAEMEPVRERSYAKGVRQARGKVQVITAEMVIPAEDSQAIAQDLLVYGSKNNQRNRLRHLRNNLDVAFSRQIAAVAENIIDPGSVRELQIPGPEKLLEDMASKGVLPLGVIGDAFMVFVAPPAEAA